MRFYDKIVFEDKHKKTEMDNITNVDVKTNLSDNFSQFYSKNKSKEDKSNYILEVEFEGVAKSQGVVERKMESLKMVIKENTRTMLREKFILCI